MAYRAAGVGGGITGMGAHIFLIDDPIKDRQEADSETIRNSVWDWYSSTAYTRLAPGGGMLVIQTRWHDDDLSGRLERKMNEELKEIAELRMELKELRLKSRTPGDHAACDAMAKRISEIDKTVDKWEIVKYPALATSDEYLSVRTGKIVTEIKGESVASSQNKYRLLRKRDEALHPARFPWELLMRYKRTMLPRDWSALYQQNPVPDEGIFFTAEMFRYRPTIPDHREFYKFVAWDLAIGQKNTNDWTVGIVGGLDWDDNLWLLDLIRGRWHTHQIAEHIIDTHMRYEAMLTGIEKGQLELAIKPQLMKRMQERQANVTLAEGDEALRPITDKIARARPLQGRMQQGKIILPSDQPWVDVLRSELLRFPSGLHDDIVDALAWLARMVLRQSPPPKPDDRIRKSANQYTSWRERLRDIMGEHKNFMAR